MSVLAPANLPNPPKLLTPLVPSVTDSQSSDAARKPGDTERWIRLAQAGSGEALGNLVEACRGYLLLIANQELRDDLRAKVAASDLVQDTFLKAKQNFDRFTGRSEADLLAWLRRILLNHLVDVTRQFVDTDKRQVMLEENLPERPSVIALDGPTPLDQAIAREDAQRVMRAVARLPEEMRRVVELRNEQRLQFQQIGECIGRSAEACRKLWTRAIERLAQELESLDEP